MRKHLLTFVIAGLAGLAFWALATVPGPSRATRPGVFPADTPTTATSSTTSTPTTSTTSAPPPAPDTTLPAPLPAVEPEAVLPAPDPGERNTGAQTGRPAQWWLDALAQCESGGVNGWRTGLFGIEAGYPIGDLSYEDQVAWVGRILADHGASAWSCVTNGTVPWP